MPWKDSSAMDEKVGFVADYLSGLWSKKAHTGFGPKKVMDGLRREHPEEAWPADSTAGEILKRDGLVKRRRGRRVRSNGEIKWRGSLLYLSAALAGEPVGVEPLVLEDGLREVRFGFHLLGLLDERAGKIKRVEGWRREPGEPEGRDGQ